MQTKPLIPLAVACGMLLLKLWGGATAEAVPLPANGAAKHPFLYAGEWDTRKLLQSMFIVRDGKIVWALSLRTDPDLGPSMSIQLLDEPGVVENGDLQR
jgi:hypothetical protein